jgi:glucosamine--fructose-6-phosphate aminotransferase (isomerizing)
LPQRQLSVATGQRLLQALLEIPEKMKLVLEQNDAIKALAEKYKNYYNFLFLGRGVNVPVALEGSLN